jgi:hypothetical protein
MYVAEPETQCLNIAYPNLLGTKGYVVVVVVVLTYVAEQKKSTI